MAAVVDRDDGRLLETKDFSTTRAWYRALLRWMRQPGALESVGIEGTGSYGAGIMRFLTAAGVTTHEVDRPDRSDRRRRGKSDAVDAEMAARAVISGRQATAQVRCAAWFASTVAPAAHSARFRSPNWTTTAARTRRGFAVAAGGRGSPIGSRCFPPNGPTRTPSISPEGPSP